VVGVEGQATTNDLRRADGSLFTSGQIG
jgi:hypothetical protein